MIRQAMVNRTTKETQVEVTINLDGGQTGISTGIGFFDHMLKSFAVHGGFGLNIHTEGDLIVDCHHSIEDTGIVLGQTIKEAIDNSKNITRFGSSYIPMDEALSFCAVDICGRPYLKFNADFPQERVGDFDTCMTEEFFRAVAFNSGMTLHMNCVYGTNSHHMIESLFKSFAYAVKQATRVNDNGQIISTKGML